MIHKEENPHQLKTDRKGFGNGSEEAQKTPVLALKPATGTNVLGQSGK